MGLFDGCKTKNILDSHHSVLNVCSRSSNTQKRKLRFLVGDGDRIALRRGGKINQAALFLKTVRMEVSTLPLSPPARCTHPYPKKIHPLEGIETHRDCLERRTDKIFLGIHIYKKVTLSLC